MSLTTSSWETSMSPVTDWLTAIGTVGAWGFAMTLFALGRRDRIRAQASGVSAWVTEVVDSRPFTDLGPRRPVRGKSVHLQVRNGSSDPVYGFSAWIHHDYTSNAGVTGSRERTQPVPPGEVDMWVDDVDSPTGGLADFPYVDIEFRGASGRCWRRLHDGSIRRERSGRSLIGKMKITRGL
jgi:hypothetical protein